MKVLGGGEEVSGGVSCTLQFAPAAHKSLGKMKKHPKYMKTLVSDFKTVRLTLSGWVCNKLYSQ